MERNQLCYQLVSIFIFNNFLILTKFGFTTQFTANKINFIDRNSSSYDIEYTLKSGKFIWIKLDCLLILEKKNSQTFPNLNKYQRQIPCVTWVEDID